MISFCHRIALLDFAPEMMNVVGERPPTFSMERYTMSVATGSRREKELREAEKKGETEQKHVDNSRKVPLAMAPPNEETSWENEIKSELRYRNLFPGIIALQAHSVEGEYSSLSFYIE